MGAPPQSVNGFSTPSKNGLNQPDHGASMHTFCSKHAQQPGEVSMLRKRLVAAHRRETKWHAERDQLLDMLQAAVRFCQ